MGNGDSELSAINRCLGGDGDAFGEIINLHKDRIFSFAWRMLQNPSDAEDIAQETFIKAYRALGSYKRDCPLRPWLLRIARNLCIDFIRRRSPQALSTDDEDFPLELEDSAPGPERAADEKFYAEAAEKLLATLPPLYREALLLQYKEDLTIAEIARLLDLPEATVKTRLFRAKALARLKLCAEKERITL